MVDDFMVCVDRIIASACLESLNDRERLLGAGPGVGVGVGVGNEVADQSNVSNNNGVGGAFGFDSGGGGEGCSKSVKECRICQEEDEEHEMEAPCACSGTLKFAHRKCIQRWCNKKGDITCEICYQVFSPNYTSPPARDNSGVMTIDIRQAWGTHVDIRDPQFLAFTAAERQFLHSEYDDDAIANSVSLACFRAVAIALMLILLVRQVLMVTRDFAMLQESSTSFNVSLLQLAGFLLPCYVVARSWYILQSRRRQQVFQLFSTILGLNMGCIRLSPGFDLRSNGFACLVAFDVESISQTPTKLIQKCLCSCPVPLYSHASYELRKQM